VTTPTAAPPPTLPLRANTDIQGDILAGFKKDHVSLLFLQFDDPARARSWLADLAPRIATTKQVAEFNERFSAARRSSGGDDPEALNATWLGVSLTYSGLRLLSGEPEPIPVAPPGTTLEAFVHGAAARARDLGDIEDSGTDCWLFGHERGRTVHAVLTLASDTAGGLREAVDEQREAATRASALLVFQQNAATLAGERRGHEHFGFKDGVSQPGIRSINPPDDPIANPNQGHPGQDLLHPGEFVLGYPTQIPIVDPDVDGPNPNPGPNSASGPAWTDNGSYLVFRRLAQDVPAFHNQVAALAAAHGMHPDLVGAKLVGRYQSGCPLEARAFQPSPFHVSSTDPERFQPGVADSDALNNNFEFGDDLLGQVCPMASHIRKAYPRDEPTPAAPNSEPETQTHRLLRRGIPFGRSFGAPVGGDAGDPRGLVFQCYQKSIANQFEFVQQSWVNNASFPPGANGGVPGEDPIIAQSVSGPFQLDPSKPNIAVKHFVTTTGGEYFLTPSISTLQKIGSGAI